MQEMKVICAKVNQEHQRLEIVREIINDNGSIEYNCLSIPQIRLEWIAAEYEIDDVDELVEMVIYESFLPKPNIREDVVLTRQRRRADLSELKIRLGSIIPSIDKEEQKARLRNAGIADEYVTAVDNDAIQVIKQRCRIDQQSLQEKREFCRKRRRGEKARFPGSRDRETIHKEEMENVRQPTAVRQPRTVDTLDKISLSGGKRVR